MDDAGAVKVRIGLCDLSKRAVTDTQYDVGKRFTLLKALSQISASDVKIEPAIANSVACAEIGIAQAIDFDLFAMRQSDFIERVTNRCCVASLQMSPFSKCHFPTISTQHTFSDLDGS